MRVRGIMTKAVHVVWHDAPVETAADLMTTHAVTALPVVDAHCRLVGMVGESDLLWHRVAAEPLAGPDGHADTIAEPGRRPGIVGEVMSEYPVTTTPGADVADVAQVMLDHDVRSLPVLEDGEIIGIVSRRDILKAMVRDDSLLAEDVQRRVDEYAGRRGRWAVTADAGVVTVTGGFPNEQQRTVVALLARTVPGVAGVRLPEVDGSNGSAPRNTAVLA
ncbi:CBS domain-containing protein [Actinoplanes sp. NPDC020271]|uniref:CBS domain-containing protein n=1 Tax=Actinoplanes sp. NPDC020271 TaxID=3363896 RepID=UPI00379EC8CF